MESPDTDHWLSSQQRGTGESSPHVLLSPVYYRLWQLLPQRWSSSPTLILQQAAQRFHGGPQSGPEPSPEPRCEHYDVSKSFIRVAWLPSQPPDLRTLYFAA